MLNKQEKLVLLYLLAKCKPKQVNLVYAEEIIEHAQKSFIISLSSLETIMLSLSRNNYLEYVTSYGKRGEGFCITLKEKSQTYFVDMQKKRSQNFYLALRTCALAILSFVVGLILKGLFS